MLTNSIFFALQSIFVLFSTLSFITLIISYFKDLDTISIFLVTLLFNILIIYLINFFRKSLEVNKINFIYFSLIGWLLIILVGIIPLFELLENTSLNEKIYFSTSLATTSGFSIPDYNFNDTFILSIWVSIIENIGALYTILIFICYSSLFLNNTFISITKRNILNLNLFYLLFLSSFVLILYIFNHNLLDSFMLASSLLTSAGYKVSGSVFLNYDENYILIIFLMFFSLLYLPLYLAVCSKNFYSILKNIFKKNKISLLLFLLILMVCLLILSNDGLSLIKSLSLIISLITTTGVLPSDFQNTNILEYYSNYLFIFLFVVSVGTFSGTTNGGIKLNKLSLFFFNIKDELNKFLYQHNIKGIVIIKKGSSQKELNSLYSVLVFSLISIFICTLFLNLSNMDLKDSFIYILAALTNTGESLLILGNVNYITDHKFYFILNILMICGRFESIGYLLLFKKIIR